MPRGSGMPPTRRRRREARKSGPTHVDVETYLRHWLRRPAGMTTEQTKQYLAGAPGIRA
jgi:hypothetical protein